MFSLHLQTSIMDICLDRCEYTSYLYKAHSPVKGIIRKQNADYTFISFIVKEFKCIHKVARIYLII